MLTTIHKVWKYIAGPMLVVVAATTLPMQVFAQQEKTAPSRHIIICVDGVSISTISDMQAEGHFKMFHSPSYMISTFPSLTNAAISTILGPSGSKPPRGYEDNYFDIEENKMRGGVIDRLRSDRFIHGTFRELFDYHPSAIKSGLGYAAPPISIYLESVTDLIRLRQKARKNQQPVFLAYTGASDSLAHIGGEKLLRSFLKQLDETVRDIARDSKAPVVVTIFSDHGNDFRKYKRAGLKAPLERAGFKLDTGIRDDRSIVFPQFGLIGSAVLFTREANERHVAGIVSSLEGVDFAAYESGGVVQVVGPGGEATIEKRGDKFRYSAVKGDPLNLLSFVQGYSNGNGADGFISDSAWFAATRNNARPDVVKRIYEGATSGVQNRGSVIVNFEDGYYSGSSFLDAITILQATHGNIGQAQSYGFVMSTKSDLPPYLRADDLWTLLGSPVLVRSKPDK